jgi:hypothetical protein
MNMRERKHDSRGLWLFYKIAITGRENRRTTIVHAVVARASGFFPLSFDIVFM